MTNTALLKQKISDSGLKLGFIADRCGLTYQGFKNKLDGIQEFRQNEIFNLQALLKLSNEEAWEIFFAENVD